MMTSTFKPTLFLTMGRTLAFMATFFIPVVLVRTFSQTEFGTYKQLLLLYSTLYAIAQFGMAESLFYFVPRAPRESGPYVANSLLFLAVAGVAAMAAIAVSRSELGRSFSNIALTDHVVLLGVFLLLMMPSAVLEIVLVARGDYRLASAVYAVSDIARAMLFLVPVLVFGWGIDGLLLGGIAFAALRLAATLAFLAGRFGAGCRPALRLLTAQLGYAVPFGLAGALEIVQSTFHQYAVSYRFDAATFAIYAVGCFQVPLVDFVATSAGNVLMVQMGQEANSPRERAIPAWHRATRELALMLVPLVALLMVTARDLVVLLFTANYLASVPIFKIWSASILLAALPTDAVLRVHADTRFLLGLYALKLAVVVAALPWALSTWGLPGAVLVTLLAGVMAKGLALGRTRRLMRTGYRGLLPWRQLAGIALAAAAAAVPCALVGAALDTTPAPRLIAMGVVYAVAYLALLLALRLVTDDERLALGRWTRRWTAAIAQVAHELRRATRPVASSRT